MSLNRFGGALMLAAPLVLGAQAALTPIEAKIRETLQKSHDEQIAYLERVVNIPSSTLNLAGVRKVGAVFKA